MKRPLDINKTFAALRQMPLEVSFSKVSDWVRNAPAAAPAQRSWLSIFQRYFFSEN